jgi:hypothetical protein
VYLDNGMVPGPIRTAHKKAAAADMAKEQRKRKPTKKTMKGAFIIDSALLKAELEGLDYEMERTIVQTVTAAYKNSLKALQKKLKEL